MVTTANGPPASIKRPSFARGDMVTALAAREIGSGGIGLHDRGLDATSLQPNLELNVPIGKHKLVRRAEVERRLAKGEWYGAKMSLPSISQDAARAAEEERSEARKRESRKAAEQRTQVLAQIQQEQAPLLPPVSDRASSSRSERQLARQASQLLGRSSQYVSPGGVINLAQRTMTARLLWLLRAYGIRKDGTRFTERELQERQGAVADGTLPAPQLPYRTAAEIRIAPVYLRGLPNTSSAGVISANTSRARLGDGGSASAVALVRGANALRATSPVLTSNGSHIRSQRFSESLLSKQVVEGAGGGYSRGLAIPRSATSAPRFDHIPSRGSGKLAVQESGSNAKLQARRARIRRRHVRRMRAQRNRQAALASAGVISPLRPPHNRRLGTGRRGRAGRADEDDGSVLSDGGISSGDSDDADVVTAMAAPKAGKQTATFGALPGGFLLKQVLAQSQRQLAAMRAAPTLEAVAAINARAQAEQAKITRNDVSTVSIAASLDPTGFAPITESYVAPQLLDGSASTQLRAWASLERAIDSQPSLAPRRATVPCAPVQGHGHSPELVNNGSGQRRGSHVLDVPRPPTSTHPLDRGDESIPIAGASAPAVACGVMRSGRRGRAVVPKLPLDAMHAYQWQQSSGAVAASIRPRDAVYAAMDSELSDDDSSAFVFAGQESVESDPASALALGRAQMEAVRLASAGASRGIVLDASGVHTAASTAGRAGSDAEFAQAALHSQGLRPQPLLLAAPPSAPTSNASRGAVDLRGGVPDPRLGGPHTASTISDMAGRRAIGAGSQRKVPEWVLRAVEEAKAVPSLSRLELEAWAAAGPRDDACAADVPSPAEQGIAVSTMQGSLVTSSQGVPDLSSSDLSVPPDASAVHFAMAVFNPVANGGIGASALLSEMQAERVALSHTAAMADEASEAGTGSRLGVSGPSSDHSVAGKGLPEGGATSLTAEEAAEAETRKELEDPHISALSTRLDVEARGLPVAEPIAEPYLPLTDRRPTRPPRSAPSLRSERQRLQRQAVRRLREQEKATAEEAAQAKARSVAVTSVDTTGVSTQPIRLCSGALVRSALGAAAAADEARRLRASARRQTERELASLTTRSEIAASTTLESKASSAGPAAVVGDRHGAFLEVRGQFFTIPQSVMDRAAAAVVQQEVEARAAAAQRALARIEAEAAQPPPKPSKPDTVYRQSFRLTSRSGSQSFHTDSGGHSSGRDLGRMASGLETPLRGTTPRVLQIAGRSTRACSSNRSVRIAFEDFKDDDDSGNRDDDSALGNNSNAADQSAGNAGRSRNRSREGTSADGSESEARGPRPPLGALASMTKASWGSWRRAPVRPVVARAMRQAASARLLHGSGSISARDRARPPLHAGSVGAGKVGCFTGRSSVELSRLSARLEGVDEASLGAGDLFELSRVEGDKLLQDRVVALVRGRATAREYLSAAVERQLNSRSLADLTEEELPLIRIEAEVERTLHAEAQSAGTQWFRQLLSRVAALQEENDVSPAQLLLLTLVHHAFDQGRQPCKADLIDSLYRFTHDEFVSPGVQLLLAFLRRFVRMPLSEFGGACKNAGHTAPAEVAIERAAQGKATKLA